MTLQEILKVTKGHIISGEKKNKELGKICIDSRTIEKNDIFVALKGTKTDSNIYIKDIINKASAIITNKRIKYKSKTPIIKVRNPKKSIIKIGKYNRKKFIDKPLIAITGSVGKTTTKDLISDIFKTKYNILKSDKNNNNMLGMSLTLSKINEKNDIIILELGMNHLKEIEKMSKICKPSTAIITNIGTSHIGILKTQENILKAKMEITKYLKRGNLIVNGNDFFLNKIKETKKFSILKTNQDNVNEIILNKTLNFKIDLENKTYNVNFKIPNKYLIDNILLAIKVSILYQIPVNNIIKAIENFKSTEQRSEIIDLKNNITLINDCYNASLESIKSSLSMIENDNKNKIIIIGDVLELGNHTKEIHKKIEEELKKIKNAKIITVGEYTKNIETHYNSNEEIIKYLEKQNLENTTILIKASRKMHLEEIKNYLVSKYKITIKTQ